MKEGDIGVELLFTIERKDGKEIDFSDVDSFTLYMQYEGETEVNSVPLTVVDETAKTVNYYTVDGDLSQPGKLLLEVKVEMKDGHVFRTKTVKVKVEDSLSYPEEVQQP